MSRPPAPSPADEPLDGHLRAALRHAPDADLGPPPALSEAILRQARATTAAAPATKRAAAAKARWSPWTVLAAAWEALSRPSLASGLASVMLASLVGLMWWDRMPDDVGSVPRSESTKESTKREVAADSGAPRPAAAPEPLAEAPAIDRAAAAPPTAAPPLQQEDRKAAAPAAAAGRQATAPGRPDTDAVKAKARRAEGPQAATAAQTAPDEPTAAAAAAAAPPTRDNTAPWQAPQPSIATAPMPAPAPPAAPVAAAPAAEPAPAAEARVRERMLKSLPEAESERLAGGQSQAARDGGFRAALQARPAASGALSKSLAAASPPGPPLSTLRESLAQQPERWTWQHGGGAPQPVTAPLLRWLASLETATALGPPWVDAPYQAAPADAAAPQLRLLLDGRPAHTLLWQADGLRWHAHLPPSTGAWQAPLPAQALQELLRALPNRRP